MANYENTIHALLAALRFLEADLENGGVLDHGILSGVRFSIRLFEAVIDSPSLDDQELQTFLSFLASQLSAEEVLIDG